MTNQWEMMIHWFKKHPQYLALEAKELATNPNYRQLHSYRNNFFVSHGLIIVRLDKIYRFPFLIVYSHATPYSLPYFFPLIEELSDDVVEAISKLDGDKIWAYIKPYVKIYPHLRHQNGSGNLCILEWDNLDNGAKFLGVKTLLERVKDWCKGLLTNEFPPDSQEVSYVSHFHFVDDNISFFYPESFLNSEIVEGEAYAVKLSFFPKTNDYPHDRYSFLGSLLVGKAKNGLTRCGPKEFTKVFTDIGIHNELDLINKGEVVDKLVNDKELLKCYWFNIGQEPPPFETLENLIGLIGEGDRQAGLLRLTSNCVAAFKSKPEFVYVALRFPNRKSILEFQLFRLEKTNNERAGLIGATSDMEMVEYIIEDYTKVKAIPSSKFSDEEFHIRNEGRISRQTLQTKTLLFAGVGAVGSEIADIMAKAGVSIMGLFDNQLMKIENSVRHLCGLEYIGVPKTEAVRQVLLNHNPFISVYSIPRNINDINIDDYKEDAVFISSLAEDNTEAFLNERAVISNRTVYYVRALRGGTAARIYRVIPGRDACMQCLSLYRIEGDVFITIPEDPDLPTIRTECNNPIRPGSAADLKLISSLASQVILDDLEKGPHRTNHWIWSTESLNALRPFHLLPQFIPPHPDCYYCSHKEKLTVVIEKEMLTYMQSLVLAEPNIETGGVLAGYILDGVINITHVSGPGPNAVRKSTEFIKDKIFCQDFLDKLLISSEGKITYVGEWHSHPSTNNNPSSQDLKSLTEIASEPNYLTDEPVMIILGNTGEAHCSIHPFGKLYYRADLIAQ